jgi:hypothetical protein
LGHKVFCYWIPLPASYRSYGWWFDHIPPVKRILVSWSSWTSASLDYDQDLLLCWTSHEISTHYSRSLQLSRREKSHHPNWLCQLHKKRRFASTFPGVSKSSQTAKTYTFASFTLQNRHKSTVNERKLKMQMQDAYPSSVGKSISWSWRQLKWGFGSQFKPHNISH